MASVATKKSAAKKSKGNGMMQLADKVQSVAENLRKDLRKQINGVGKGAKVRSAKLAVTMIKLQRTTFDRAFKILSQVQKRSDKLIKDHVEEASWMPAEGSEVVKEWSRTLNDGRAEFQKTVDKSYDLLRTYFERIEKSGKAVSKRANAAGKKISTGKKKTTTKRTATAKHKTAPASMSQPTM
jgi:hypothetical protein